ncbi:hypothetical protein BaRGS_00027267 [Batillaria attramentaria]|uniref:Elongator complex protein 4 n=1 Tax=Batillaria attramentaria TaxID=370345 RepID=A0ABD0K278_9CAEN
MATSTSFQKRVKAKVRQIPGTKPSLYNNQLLISTGIPSLDTVLGGGVAVGTLLLVEEDLYGTYTQVMVKYFAAEAVTSGQSLCVVSADVDPNKIVQELPAPVVDDVPTSQAQQPQLSKGSGDADEKLAIAWRYQHQPKVQSAPVTSRFGHYYDLTKIMDESKISSAQIQCLSYKDLRILEETKPNSCTSTTNPCYASLLQRIQKQISEGNYGTAVKNDHRNVLRIVVQGLGSGMWGENGGAHYRTEERDASLHRLLLALRATLRTAFAVCLITVPMYLFQDPAFVWRAERLCDTVLRLESFAGSDKEKNPAFRDYSGLLHLVQLPCLNELLPHMPDTLDLAFRLRRKKFTIEKLHMPPELSETVSRDQEDPVPSLRPTAGCGTGSSKLDF